MKELNSVFIGCVEFSGEMLLELIRCDARPNLVLTKNKSNFNSDFLDLSGICQTYGIDVVTVNDINSDDVVKIISGYNPDVIFCFGWSSLIKNNILDIPKIGVIGYHPSLLPSNRGRHPVIWALALGLEKTGSTFFLMDEDADTGDIISQREVNIYNSDCSASLYKRLIEIGKSQVNELVNNIKTNSIIRLKQSKNEGNYWRKRGKIDGLIDFRMSTKNIFNLIRALNKPYPGAHFLYANTESKVWSAESGNMGFNNFEPGKVIEIDQKRMLIKTGDGTIWLNKHDLVELPHKGSYLG